MCVVLVALRTKTYNLKTTQLCPLFKCFKNIFHVYCTPKIQNEKQEPSPYPMQYHQRQCWQNEIVWPSRPSSFEYNDSRHFNSRDKTQTICTSQNSTNEIQSSHTRQNKSRFSALHHSCVFPTKSTDDVCLLKRNAVILMTTKGGKRKEFFFIFLRACINVSLSRNNYD